MHMENAHPGHIVARIVGMTILGLVGAVIIAFLFGYFVMLLWNWLLPPLFHAGTINYWQAIGIVILAKILFGGTGVGHSHRGHRDWKREARRWDCWESGHGRHGWKGPWSREEGECDEWAPKGSHGNWRYYGKYWKDEGKASFEAWLNKQEKDGDKGPVKGPDQPQG
jgi:hypothetical protein